MMTEVVGHVTKQEIFEIVLWLSFVTKEQFEHQGKNEPLVETDDSWSYQTTCMTWLFECSQSCRQIIRIGSVMRLKAPAT